MNDQQMSLIALFFNRLSGDWWIIGETLKRWVTHRELVFFPGKSGVAVTCAEKTLEQYSDGRGVVLIDGVLHFGKIKIKIKCSQEISDLIVARGEELEKLRPKRSDISYNGLWKVNIVKSKPYQIQIPYRFGELLDRWKPLWWKDNTHNEFVHTYNWFTSQRKARAYELMGIMLDCGERAGIRDTMWLGFGGLLGYVVCGDFLPHDNDIDMCIDTEKATPKNIAKYLVEIRKPFNIGCQKFPHGLGEKMFRTANHRDDNGNPLWISIGHRSVANDNGVKSCNWFMFEYSNHYWHSKGDRWIQGGNFGNVQISKLDKAICLGQPSGTLDQFTEVDFHGVAVSIPKNAGTCLDWWYPGWFPGGKGSSEKRRILCVGDWNNKSKWRLF